MLKNNWDKIELYILSLWLLFLLIIIVTINIPICFGKGCSFIGIKKVFSTNYIPILASFFFLIGVFSYFRFKYKLSGSQQNFIKIRKIENKDYEHLTFLSTYIIPLIAFDLTKTRYSIVLIVLLVAIGIMYIQTGMFYSNPTLALLGYKIYKINATFRTKEEDGIIIIARETINLEDKLSFRKIHDNIYYARVLR
ncbi:anti-phage protein KwaA [Bacillus mycoides]|uniref:Uncharacterized protein n=1 Tax=Bacillus mycoides TaxID=1405 RepID=A0A4V5TSG1_BACMY|nr:anti-phage protein KwaA [Bacillus mycoides]QWG31780.1 hypothetical protein EXW30_01930 [Bacillus mycoides]TKI85833.1 hypothetical protein FC701_08680 [Bacillus mycoides]